MIIPAGPMAHRVRSPTVDSVRGGGGRDRGPGGEPEGETERKGGRESCMRNNVHNGDPEGGFNEGDLNDSSVEEFGNRKESSFVSSVPSSV